MPFFFREKQYSRSCKCRYASCEWANGTLLNSNLVLSVSLSHIKVFPLRLRSSHVERHFLLRADRRPRSTADIEGPLRPRRQSLPPATKRRQEHDPRYGSPSPTPRARGLLCSNAKPSHDRDRSMSRLLCRSVLEFFHCYS